jgi:hypothetical protein
MIKVTDNCLGKPSREGCVQRHCGHLSGKGSVCILPSDHQSDRGREIGAGEICTYQDKIFQAIAFNVKRCSPRDIAINGDVVDFFKGTVAIVDDCLSAGTGSMATRIWKQHV